MRNLMYKVDVSIDPGDSLWEKIKKESLDQLISVNNDMFEDDNHNINEYGIHYMTNTEFKFIRDESNDRFRLDIKFIDTTVSDTSVSLLGIDKKSLELLISMLDDTRKFFIIKGMHLIHNPHISISSGQDIFLSYRNDSGDISGFIGVLYIVDHEDKYINAIRMYSNDIINIRSDIDDEINYMLFANKKG